VQGQQRIAGRPGPEPPSDDVLIKVATAFYIQGRQQADIARELEVNPATVSRYIRRARAEGIVHIEIRRPEAPLADLGRELAARYGLRRATVVPGGRDPDASVALSAAEQVSGLLRNGTRLGLSWGESLASAARRLEPGIVSDLSVAQLSGGLGDSAPGIQGHEVVRHVASLYPRSAVHYLHAPVIVGSPSIKRALLSDRAIRSSLAAAARSEIGLVGIGSFDEQATLFRGHHVSAADWQRLAKHGAVGSVNGRFFDAQGRPVTDLEDRTLAIEWKELDAIPTVVAIARGPQKHAAIRGALLTGAIDMFVTDEPAAHAALARS
jgi:deoxyribonucleoside regulator